MIAYAQLTSAGLSSSAIGRRIARRDLTRRHEGVYAVGRPGLTPYGEAWAAALAAGRRGALAGWSAAAATDLAPWPAMPRIVVIGGPLDLRDVITRRTRSLPADDVHEGEGGLRFTSWPRTVTDLAAHASIAELQTVLDRLEGRDMLDLAVLAEAMKRARGRAGIKKLRRALAPYTSIPAGDYQSLLERFSAMVLHADGLGKHQTQAAITLPSGRTIHVDVLFRKAMVVVEVDGRSSHDRSSQFVIDRERDRELQKLGYIVLRFTWHDVKHRPQVVVRDIRACLTARRDA